MSFILVVGVLAAVLFGAAFVSKRRFGLPVLGLAVGTLLSNLWAPEVTQLVTTAGVVLVQPPLEAVVAVGLTLLPALLLLFAGKKQKSLPMRMLGAAVFAVLAVVTLQVPLGAALVIDTTGQPVYDAMVNYHDAIVTAGLVLALIDILFAKSPKHIDPTAKH